MSDKSFDSIIQAPNIVNEILLRLKVQDAMSVNLTTVGKDETLRRIQKLMKEKRVSGIPIVKDRRLIGIISVDDIIKAFDMGYIEEKAEKYITKKIVVLESDMPLTFAINYFNKYSFGRFPVIDKEQKLVGILTSRDVLSRLIEELNKEIGELENKIENNNPITKPAIPHNTYREFTLKRFDFESAGKASFEIKKELKDKGLPTKIIRRVAIASYELEINVIIHSKGGKMKFILDDNTIYIIAEDNGPGIEDTDKVVKEGYSTANDWIRSMGFGAGMGLPNIKRVSDKFEIESQIGKGAKITSIIYYE